MRIGKQTKVVNGGTYNVPTMVGVVLCDTSKKPCNIIIPNILSGRIDALGYRVVIQDIGNNASNNPITISTTNKNEKINGQQSIVLNTDGVSSLCTPFGDFYWTASGTGGGGGGSKEGVVTNNLPPFQVISIPEVTKDNYIFSDVSFFQYSKVGAVNILTPNKTDGSGAIGNLSANINNNNFSDLCYNNFGTPSATNLAYYTFDFGSPKSLDRWYIRWWQVNQYVPQYFRIEGNNTWSPDPTDPTWNTVVDNLTGTNIISRNQYINILDDTPYQYWRMFVYTGFGGQFMVCTEMTPETAGTLYESITDSNRVTMYFNSDGVLQVESLTNIDVSVTARYKI
jgi:hypothetical protein